MKDSKVYGAKTVLVTGGTVRIGKAIAAVLEANDWRVITSSHREEAAANIVCDLRGENAAEELFKKARELAGGQLDAVVNNAALYVGPNADIASINFAAPARLTELMAEHGGAVVNILDAREMDANTKRARATAYQKSKRDLLRSTIDAARRHSPGLRVNGVAPGPVLAPVGASAKAGLLLAAKPTAFDVAEAVRFLLETPSVTGIVIPVDGGQHLVG